MTHKKKDSKKEKDSVDFKADIRSDKTPIITDTINLRLTTISSGKKEAILSAAKGINPLLLAYPKERSFKCH